MKLANLVIFEAVTKAYKNRKLVNLVNSSIKFCERPDFSRSEEKIFEQKDTNVTK